MASKVRKNARKKKINGQMINLSDPQNNPDMFPENGGPGPTAQPLRAADPKGQQSQAPQFAAWDNVGYTAYIGNKQKTKNGQPTVPTSEPKMNRDIHPLDQTLALPQRTKLEPQLEAWQEVPVFEAQAQCVFDQHWGGNEWRKAPLNRARIPPRLTGGARFPLLNQDRVDERARSLVREDDDQVYGGGGSLTVQQTSGNSEDLGKVGYTASFGNKRTTKNGQPTVPGSEPEMNRDIHPPDQTQEAWQKVPLLNITVHSLLHLIVKINNSLVNAWVKIFSSY